MNNALWVAWRVPCLGLRTVAFRPTELRTFSTYTTRPSLLSFPTQVFSLTSQLRQSPVSTISRRFKRTSAKSNPEAILPRVPDAEIKAIFGPSRFSPKLGNRILNTLQGHRLTGTLDAELPSEIVSGVNQQQIDTAMDWLRNKYPVDEDAAILARIEREERAEQDKLMRRAEKLGLYKPQSGSYEAELGEEGSPYGKSVLIEARQQNEKRLLAEQQRLSVERERQRQEWLDGEREEQERLDRRSNQDTSLQQYQENALMEARPRADPNERPVLAWVQKHHIAGTHETPEDANITTTQRLLAPILFTITVLGLCYAFAQKYEFPARNDRFMPDVPPAVATVGAIVGANLAVTLLWKFVPPAWRLLNRYFVIVPFYPSSLGMIGSTFSHQTWRHLGTNMMVLALMGTRVHDEIGRGNFLAIYFASGAMGSIFSLTRSVILGNLGMTSLGASAATSGIVAAWCMSHFDDKITMWILPHELREKIWTHGWFFLACLVGTEVFSLIAPARFFRVWPLSRLTKMDHAAHLGGFVAGAGCGYTLMQKQKERERKARQSKWF
ncbi:Peptidase S54 rhomboid [Penicillium brevicompactum]|uniref:Peptidase S54 rhomboid n=1 Tax=Penicillium brevicompactum TaxID=5074 RepID=A0A9W9USQ7_PENBR|nr:Peptidase S54 rhomboid [Penicillium brevicompactum]